MKEAQKKYKDTVFRLLFKDPARALNLYNSIMGTDYTDVEMLRFNTLENAIYMNVKNDLSFVIADRLNIYEQGFVLCGGYFTKGVYEQDCLQ